MSVIDSLLRGLFDYAGLYPPASLSTRSAANNYLEYRDGERSWALGRFIVNLDRIEELRSVAGDSFRQMRLSVVATEKSDWEGLAGQIRNGAPVEAVEIKCDPAEIERVASRIPHGLMAYFEIGMDAARSGALKEIVLGGARAKIRMGGVVPDAFPPVAEVAQVIAELAALRLPFKATAGLHHPIRAQRPLTYQPQSPQGVMHGFVNLCCASAMLYFGGDRRDAEALLEESDESTWRVAPDAIQWRNRSLTAAQMGEMRERFLISIGSCSFEEPIHDLESLGWL